MPAVKIIRISKATGAVIVGFVIFAVLMYVFIASNRVEPLSSPNWMCTLILYGSLASIVASAVELRILKGYRPWLQYSLIFLNFLIPILWLFFIIMIGCAIGGCNLLLEDFLHSTKLILICVVPLVAFIGFYFITRKLTFILPSGRSIIPR